MNSNLLAAANFWNTPIGEWTVNILGALGIVVVLAAVVKSIGKFVSGDISKGVKNIVGGLIIGAICIHPQLITDLISTVADLLGKGSQSVDQIGSGSGGAGAAQ